MFGLFHEETDVCVAMGVVYCMKWCVNRQRDEEVMRLAGLWGPVQRGVNS